MCKKKKMQAVNGTFVVVCVQVPIYAVESYIALRFKDSALICAFLREFCKCVLCVCVKRKGTLLRKGSKPPVVGMQTKHMSSTTFSITCCIIWEVSLCKLCPEVLI